jgi:hypothetical protein
MNRSPKQFPKPVSALIEAQIDGMNFWHLQLPVRHKAAYACQYGASTTPIAKGHELFQANGIQRKAGSEIEQVIADLSTLVRKQWQPQWRR